jgi:Flp pilus assembly pilin Flp
MMTTAALISQLARRLRQEEGATSIEYALVLLTIALVLVFALATGVDGVLGGTVSEITNSLP